MEWLAYVFFAIVSFYVVRFFIQVVVEISDIHDSNDRNRPRF